MSGLAETLADLVSDDIEASRRAAEDFYRRLERRPLQISEKLVGELFRRSSIDVEDATRRLLETYERSEGDWREQSGETSQLDTRGFAQMLVSSACEVFLKWGAHPDGIPVYVDWIRQHDGPVAQPAITAIERLGYEAWPAVRDLLETHWLRDDRWWPGHVVAPLAIEDGPIRARIIACLVKGPTARRCALDTLLRMDSAAADADRLIVAILHDGNDPEAEAYAMMILGNIGHGREEFVDLLLPYAERESGGQHWDLKPLAIQALGKIACRPERVVPLLVKATDDAYGFDELYVDRCALEALAHFGDAALPYLDDALRHRVFPSNPFQ